MIKPLLIHLAAIYFGWMIGLFGSIACAVWAFALYSVFGEGRRLAFGFRSPAKFPPHEAVKRLLVRMPLLVLVHPLPWAIAGVGYLAYLVLSVPMNSGQLTLAVAVLGGFAYGLFKVLRRSEPHCKGGTT